VFDLKLNYATTGCMGNGISAPDRIELVEMRVLDIGCGMGDVTMLAAQLVGPTGSVVSVDQDSASIETARRRVSAILYQFFDSVHRNFPLQKFTERS
jgi:ubiquinone/menaquinone biosynthesis C-methylase UbiE